MKDLCGTAAGFNALGTEHRRTCDACRTASRNWAAGYFAALHLSGPDAARQWAAENPPKETR